MSGVRVKDIPIKCEEKHIKIHFSKPENGGGPIERIYYPLFNNDAVVIFENSETVETVLAVEEHVIMKEELYVEELPFPEAFTVLEAKLEPSVAALIQATDKIKDEIQYHMNVEFCYDQADCLTGVRGNWYMLECLWAYIDNISKRQARARRRQVQLKPQAYNKADQSRQFPMEVDDQMISMPSVSNKSVATDEQFSDEDNKLEDLRNVGSETNTNTKIPKKAVTAVKDKKFGKIEHKLEKKKTLEEELDSSIEHLSGLDLAETENSKYASEGTEVNSSEIVIINNTPDDFRSLDFRFGPLKVSVYSGLITMAETDAIVNAANGSLGHYGGIADAIARAAGVEMERQCEEYIRKYGSVPTTEVMHTCAGGTISEKVKYIMHAVGPMWTSLSEKKCAKELTQTFFNCMIYGNDVLKLHSVTMPVISSGVFGCPLEICIRSFLNAVLLFANEHMNDSIHLREVNLVNNNNDNTAMTVMQLRGLFSKETRTLVREAEEQIQQEIDDFESLRYVKREQGQGLSPDRDTSYSLGSRLDHTSEFTRDNDNITSRKHLDLSIRDQHPINMPSTKYPTYLDSKSGIFASDGLVDKSDVERRLPSRETKVDVSSKRQMTPPPTKSYNTEESGFSRGAGSSRNYSYLQPDQTYRSKYT